MYYKFYGPEKQGLRYQSLWWDGILFLFLFLFCSSTLLANTPVNGGGFESPNIAEGTFRYHPPGTAWNYVGSAGVSANKSGFTRGNPHAPEGDQVLFIQSQGFLTQTINLPATGDYTFSFKAAQRANVSNGGQTFVLKVDGQVLGTFTPASIFYQSMQTTAVQLSAGTHTIELRGTNPLGGDNTAFVDDLQYSFTALNYWSNPSTWPGGVLPGPNDVATILAGQTVILDTDADIKHLEIYGRLIADQSKDLNLSTNWILVQGQGALLQWGTTDDPYLQNAVITLKHDPNDVLPGPTMKFLAARGGGRVEIHGDLSKKSWTQLGATAHAQTTAVNLKENPGWKAGDQIVVASSDFDPHQAEVRTITTVTNGGTTCYLDDNLDYMHWGELLNYSNGTNSYTLDERAEVGLLSRNIKIQGDDLSESTGIGGHTMFMPGSEVRFSGVELYRMGQTDSLGRYPFHWHIAGNVSGQYIKDCSIHRSFNRVVTVHGTSHAVVENNVGYDHIGHGYFLEDGDEVQNVFRRNLGILTRVPAPGGGVTPHDFVRDATTQLIKLPATFWITNPENYFEGNVAAGSEGSGFWMVAQDSTLGMAPHISPPPGKRDFLQFEDNKSHSTSFSNFSIDGKIKRSNNEFVDGHYAPFDAEDNQIIPEIIRFTGYKTRARNVWMRANAMNFRECALADSPRNTFFAFHQVLHNSLIVGKSPNVGNPMSSNELSVGRSLAMPDRVPRHLWNLNNGHTVYDGPSGLSNVHMADFFGDDAFAFTINGAAQKSTVHFAEGITFENVPENNKVYFRNQSWLETMYASGLIDRDGSITGVIGGHLTPRIQPPNAADTKIREEGFNIEGAAIPKLNWHAYINPNEHFGLLRIYNGWSNATKYPTYNIRSDGPATYGQQAPNPSNMNPVIVNDSNLKYYWQYHKVPNLIRPQLKFVENGDFVISVLPNMPSQTYAYQGLSGSVPLLQASSLNDLINGSTQRYFMKDNTIYVKHIATALGNTALFGDDFSYVSPHIRFCQNANCTAASGDTGNATFADFEMGIDSRITPGAFGLPVPNVALNSLNPGDKAIYWNMRDDNDGQNEYTQITFNVPRQVWTDFQYLIIKLTGVNQFEVLTEDATQGSRNLGAFNSGTEVAIPLHPNSYAAELDEIIALTIRVHEDQLGAVRATINVFDIKLSLSPPAGSRSSMVEVTSADAHHPTAPLKVSPNPSQASFSLSMEFEEAEEYVLEIFDLSGKQLYHQRQEAPKGSWQQTFEKTSLGLHPGMYLLQLRTASHGTQTVKLLIQ